jgi:hypothetical protein
LQLIGFGEAVLLELGCVLTSVGILVKGVGVVGEGARVVDAAPPAARPKPASLLRSAKPPSPTG